MPQRTVPTARAVLVMALAAEGLLLLRPDGVLVHAAQPRGYRRPEEAASWWRNSPIHMGCSIAACRRPATRTASYRIPGPRGVTWRAYGFCDQHQPPESSDGLVYRVGRPPAVSYDVPLAPEWAEIYFLLGALAFALWCHCMWRWARSLPSAGGQAALLVAHAVFLGGLWRW